MKKLIALILLLFVGLSGFSQVSGLMGKRNLFRFQFVQSPAYAARQPVRMISDNQSKMYLAPFAFVMDIGYERILTRKIGLGVDYTFGMGRMAMAGADQIISDQSGTYVPAQIALEDPIYHNHGIMVSTSFYLGDFAPLGSYFRTGLGFSINTVNQTVKTGNLVGYDPFLNNLLQFNGQERGVYDVEATGEQQIKATRAMINIALVWGKNWLLTKRMMLNLEVGTKWNFAIDGKNVTTFSPDDIALGPGGEFSSLNYKNVNRNLFSTKARQEFIMINLGLKFAL